MHIHEITTELDERTIWARRGNQVVRKYKCQGGSRHGRIVSKPTLCFTPINFKRKASASKSTNKRGPRASLKAWHTKRNSSVSKKVAALNKMSKRR